MDYLIVELKAIYQIQFLKLDFIIFKQGDYRFIKIYFCFFHDYIVSKGSNSLKSIFAHNPLILT